MSDNSYTIEEVAQILKVSKLTVYELIKKGKLAHYRVGRQIRVDTYDLEKYKEQQRDHNLAELKEPIRTLPINSTNSLKQSTKPVATLPLNNQQQVIITGQDVSLDLLSRYLGTKEPNIRPLRAYSSSLQSIIAIVLGQADIVSTHLYDGETNQYNLPYITRILNGFQYVVINLAFRNVGFYVKKGNPKKVKTWFDLTKPEVKMVNREKGSGARVLLEEMLKLNKIKIGKLRGYYWEETSHISAARAVARGAADVAIGIEKGAQVTGIDFVPLTKERYDLVILKNSKNEGLIKAIIDILESNQFQEELNALGGYDLKEIGKIVYET